MIPSASGGYFIAVSSQDRCRERLSTILPILPCLYRKKWTPEAIVFQFSAVTSVFYVNSFFVFDRPADASARHLMERQNEPGVIFGTDEDGSMASDEGVQLTLDGEASRGGLP